MDKSKKQALLGVSILVFLGLIGTLRGCEVKEKGVYTIATVYNIDGGRSGRTFNFKYKFKGIEYESYAESPVDELSRSDEGKRFFIQVLTNNPKRCFMTSIPVPDSITEAPVNGWEEIPDF